MSYKYGDPVPANPAAPASATTYERGDMLAVDGSGVPSPAADETWDTDLATTQENFHDKFFGVSNDRTLDGETDVPTCNTKGVHEFDCASATFEVGDLVGPAKASGNALESQKVVSVATANLAIGRVAKREGTAVTKVLVEIVSTKLHGGPQAMA